MSEHDLLASEQQYEQDAISHGILFTDLEKQEVVTRACQGDRSARSDICLGLLRYSNLIAAKYAWAYAWASPRIEYQDLAQMGMLIVLTSLDNALIKREPFSYLMFAIRHEIQEYCARYSTLISTPAVHDPKRPQLTTIRTISLDVPILASSETDEDPTLGDLLPAPEIEPKSEPERYTPLFEAISTLPDRQRETIQRHYGFGCPSETLPEISRSLVKSAKSHSTTAYIHEMRALANLRKQLTPQAFYA